MRESLLNANISMPAAQPTMTTQPQEFNLSDHHWQHRLLFVFAPSEQWPAYQQQIAAWQSNLAGVNERDLQLVEIIGTGESRADGKPLAAASVEQLRQHFGIRAAEFVVVLVGKDGTEKQRYQSPIDLTQLFHTIDAMPMRQQEMQSQ